MARAFQCDACDEFREGEDPAMKITLLNDRRSGGHPVLDFCDDCAERLEDEFEWEVTHENEYVGGSL